MADNSNHDELIAQFQNITGADVERSRFYLESANWQVNLAISSFYEASDAPDDEMAASGSQPPATDKEGEKPKASPFSALKQNSDSDSDEEGQAFYAGGSSTSGQQILGPPKKKDGANFVKDIFKKAKESGHAEEVQAGSSALGEISARKAFTGTAFKLGSEESGPSEVIKSHTDERPSPREFVLKMWSNGFSIDDGDLRAYDDPANREFLKSITSGQIPRELIKEARGGEVHMNMEDHRQEEFVKPKATRKAFQGQGMMLGSVAPAVVEATTVQAMSPEDNKKAEETAKERFKVDSSQPTTNVQVRLNDGSRLLVQLNHTHTVGNLREYISVARPNLGSHPFTLSTTFPSKVLENDNVSLKDAGLLNAAIMLRLA